MKAVVPALALLTLKEGWQPRSWCPACRRAPWLRGGQAQHVGRLRKARKAQAAEGQDAWPSGSEAELARGLRRVEKEWTALSTVLAAEPSNEGTGQEHKEQAARLLVSSALDLIRPFATPFDDVGMLPLPDSERAALALLGLDFPLHVNFSTAEVFDELCATGMAFWQATFFLRHMHDSASEASVEETTNSLCSSFEETDPKLLNAMKGSTLQARQGYLTSASFGYFVRRCQQRLSLERGLLAGAADEPKGLEDYVAGLPPEAAVELVRVATHAASLALERRATALFGSQELLLDEIQRGPEAVAQISCSLEARWLLECEAAAFGAALFEAEEVALKWCDLQYTATGSRGGLGGFVVD